MNCDSVLELVPLYFYGELPPADEDRVEEHLHACASCTQEMERQRALAAALAGREIAAPAEFLEDCRADLMAAVAGVRRPVEKPPGPWRLFLDAMAHSFAGLGRLRVPLGAAAMIALGFVAARVTPQRTGAPAGASADPVVHTIRSVQPQSDGRVEISYDETHRRQVSGRMDDQNIQRLLLAASRDENPAVRVESVGVLKDGAESTDIRDALLNAAAHDPNDAVRLKAVEGLRPLGGDPEVRKILAQVLLKDDNPAVRMQVVDSLVEHRDEAIVGVLQNLMQKENNSYVRLKSEQALKAMNASVGTF